MRGKPRLEAAIAVFVGCKSARCHTRNATPELVTPAAINVAMEMSYFGIRFGVYRSTKSCWQNTITTISMVLVSDRHLRCYFESFPYTCALLRVGIIPEGIDRTFVSPANPMNGGNPCSRLRI